MSSKIQITPFGGVRENGKNMYAVEVDGDIYILDCGLKYPENELLGIELPEKIDYKITSTEPAIKGNTATNATKDAYVETGMLVKVPLFIDEGEEIIVSTKDGKYVSRK